MPMTDPPSSSSLAPSGEALSTKKAIVPLHSPLPWRVKYLAPRFVEIVCAAQHSPVIHWQGFDDSAVSLKQHEANAEFIVRACNEYAALLASQETLPTAEAYDAACKALNKHKAFLEREGYRRCDIPACNCGSWHNERAEAKWEAADAALTELKAESAQLERSNQKWLVDYGIECAKHEATRTQLAEADAARRTAEQERDTALAFLERHRYRRCDMAACNCGSWHQHQDTP